MVWSRVRGRDRDLVNKWLLRMQAYADWTRIAALVHGTLKTQARKINTLVDITSSAIVGSDVDCILLVRVEAGGLAWADKNIENSHTFVLKKRCVKKIIVPADDTESIEILENLT
mmetsp:Transcript_11257/g.31348  ORF Transcript_11257/g.31348 Transcript_11257/m.31348 type:complete len:115 (-) Transcript_11257:194-538(-)